MSEDSYIYVEEGVIYIQCRDCYKKNKLGNLWSATNGYGGNVKCKCGKVIHEDTENGKGIKESGGKY